MTQHWILGPGAIGRLLAYTITPVAAVTLIGRRTLPDRQALTTPEGERQVQSLNVTTSEQLRHEAPVPPAYLHITTKAMAAEAALESLAGIIHPSTPLVLWQNGFSAQPHITRAWTGPVLCATTTEGAYLSGNEDVVHAGRGHTFVGDLDNRHGELVEALVHTLTQAGLAATAVNDIRKRLWQKLAVNAAINPLVALHGIRNGELRGDAYSGQVAAVVKEVAAILRAEGIPPPSGQGEQAWLALVWQVVTSTANNKASMLQDREAKRTTERGAILGPLIESARRHGLSCDVLKALDAEIAALEADYLAS
ncbi:2-dehydropantoate 2-reductase [Halomonas sp. Bachu 37]|uniref:ketopantoate reductase family protein n=1 Tax=Halomonas kashgarensis TaxID=3084920 RepID=UPI003217419B